MQGVRSHGDVRRQPLGEHSAGCGGRQRPGHPDRPGLRGSRVDVYLPGDTAASPSPLTTHTGALQTSYLSAAGNHLGEVDLPGATTTTSWFFLSRVEVVAPQQAGAIVAFGDSITDGTRSTVNTNNRWPDHLAKRLQAQKINLGVLNQGIAGNRVLGDGAGVSALARFDRDVLAQARRHARDRARGINDIGLARDNACPSAADIIAAHRQLIERARARGLKIFGATLTPFEGAAYWTKEGEAKRQALNDWIRTSRIYDGSSISTPRCAIRMRRRSCSHSSTRVITCT